MKRETMKRDKKKFMVFAGITCGILTAVSSWFTISYNDSRFIVPMRMSEYTFRIQDLPMLISGGLLMLYILYLFVELMRSVITNKHNEAAVQYTRTLNPKLGFLGVFGFAGFIGFWTYSVDKTIFPFMFFIFFGYFGFFYEGKMSNTFMDERYKENRIKAHMTANKIGLGAIFFVSLIVGQGKLMGNLEYTLIAFVIAVSLSIALTMFLSEYLLYRYDQAE